MKPGSSLSSLIGSIELAQFDKKALQRFDMSMQGFWRSFSAVLAFVPLFYLVLYLQNTYVMRQGSSPEPYSLTLLAALLEWVVFTAILYVIAGFFGARERFAGAVTVYNWCRPAAFSFFIPVFAAGAAGLAGPNAMFFLFYLALSLRSFYLGYILHITLKVTLGPILAVILIEFVLGQVIMVAFARLFIV